MTALYLINKVLVKPDDDNTMSEGVYVASYNNRQFHYAVTGVVIKAPDKLLCDFEAFTELNKSKSQFQQRRIKEITRRSLPFMPNSIEIKKGDRVIYRYSVRMKKESDGDSTPNLLLDYTDIFCVLSDSNSPTLVNGFLFAEAATESININDFQFDIKDSMRAFKVVYASEYPNKGYITDRPFIESVVNVGDNVLIKKGRYRVINHHLHPVINYPKSLIAFHRSNVLGIWNR